MLRLKQILPHFENRKVNVAKALGITKQAVQKWPDGVLPEERERQIREEILPSVFANNDSNSTNTLP